MARVNGKSPQRAESEQQDEEFFFMPPHLPYVLLCHASGARCGRTFTANRIGKWRDALKERHNHESVCAVPPLVPLFLPGDLAT